MREANRTTALKGKPLAMVGPEIRVGQEAPDFRLLATDLSEVRLSHSRGRIRLFSAVQSLDTAVCDLQIKRFEAEGSKFRDVIIYAISMDLPFAQARYCGLHDITNLKTLSDHREASFGRAYGVLIEELLFLVGPGLEITKEADTEVSKVGDTINYMVEVTNTGDVHLEVVVTDSLVGELFNDILAASDSETFEYPYVVQEGDPDPLVNNATAVGTLEYLGLPNIIEAAASLELDLVEPCIDIEKTCDPSTGAVGDIITYTIIIANTGDVDLENVTVTDILMGDLSAFLVDYLAVGESDTQNFDRALEDADPNPLVNIARVDATVIILGNEVWDDDYCEVTIEEDFEGLTPGFWKANAEHWDAVAWGCTGYSPDDLFSDVFGRTITVRARGRNTITNPTLLEALNANGGGINALARHAVAALLNAAHPDINYPADVAYVIAATQDAIDSGDYEAQKDEFEMWNELGGGIDTHGNPI